MTRATESARSWLDLVRRLADLLGLHMESLGGELTADPTLQPRALTVADHLPCAIGLALPATQTVCTALAALQHRLCWRQNASYTDTGFLGSYGYCELLGPKGHCTSEAVAMGVLLLGPGIHYPAHAHPAKERYVVLGGTASWWQRGSAWRQLAPGAVIDHAGGQPHAMRTADEPLLAGYLWRDHLSHNATLLGDESERSRDR